MPINDALLNVGAGAMRTAASHLSIHTALPNASGSNESTAARKPANWGAVSGSGDFTATNIAFTGGAASGPATHVGLWSAVTGGTFYGYFPLVGDQTFNAAGEYTVTSVSLDGSAT